MRWTPRCPTWCEKPSMRHLQLMSGGSGARSARASSSTSGAFTPARRRGSQEAGAMANVVVVLEDWEHRFEDRGIPAGAALTADTSQAPTNGTDLVLVRVPAANRD